MKRFLIIGLIVYSAVLCGQRVITDVDKMEIFMTIPKETVFIHQNASTLFAGEKLYYKIYCLLAENNRLSSISKIAYVELVGSDKRVVFKHKIKLANGLGQGDFFIPANIPTGNYKLVGYTHWMKNNPKNRYFSSEVNIINLYRTNKNSLVVEKDSIVLDTTVFNKSIVVEHIPPDTVDSGDLQLVLNKKRFGKREKVSLNIETLSGENSYGNYSISVLRKDEIVDSQINNVKNSFFSSTSDITKNNNAIYLPEIRGELLYGRIVSKNDMASVANKKVAFSMPGNHFLFKMANTNSNGEFYFNIDEHYEVRNAVVQIFGNHKDEYNVVFSKKSIDYDELDFNKLSISKEKRELIQHRNIRTQIQNAYLAVKQDTIIPVTKNIPFYRDFDQVYDLDDYTRFSTIEETIVEIIENVQLRKDANRKPIFQVRGDEFFMNSDFIPLVLVNGTMVQEHSDVLKIDARRIKKISISRSDYEFALQSFRGIVAFETFDSSTEELSSEGYIKEVELIPPLSKKRYFKPNHDAVIDIKGNQAPDYRYQLHWSPNIKLKDTINTIEFFTSDVSGTYEISLEGFTLNGKYVSVRKIFKVE